MKQVKSFLLIFFLVMLQGCGGDSDSTSDTSTQSGSTDEKQASLQSASPNTIDIQGGDIITLTGEGFLTTSSYTLTVGGVVASEVYAKNGTTIMAKTPAGTTTNTKLDIALYKNAQEIARLKEAVSYTGTHSLTLGSVTPQQVPTDGADVTLTGQGFTNTMKVNLNGTQVSYTFNSKSTITIHAPANNIGDVNLTIQRGEETQTLQNAFRYVDTSLYFNEFTPDSSYATGGEKITLTGNGFTPKTKVFFGEEEAQLVTYVNANTIVATTPAQLPGSVYITVKNETAASINTAYAEASSSEETSKSVEKFDFEEVPVGYKENPYVVGVHALSNTQVQVTFSEPMHESAGTSNFYSILGDDGAAKLTIKSATLQHETLVILDVLPMSEINYRLIVNGAVDKSGRALEAKDERRPTDRMVFSGIGESVPVGGNPQDTDGDGLSDAVEQRGFVVTYTLASGQQRTEAVTSDPELRDTDGDGLPDKDEYAIASNPRSADTDKDEIDDYKEANTILSDPNHQDSDGDGFPDVAELGFGTSVTLADTDGDQFTDYQEIVEMGRNPRVTDLPRPEINMVGMNAAIDVRYVETKSNGQTNEFTKEYSASHSFTHHDFREWTVGIEAGIGYKAGAEVGLESKATTEWSLSASISGEAHWGSSEDSTNEYSSSSVSNFITDQTQEITREVTGGRITVAVNFETKSDVAFTLTDIELSLVIQDPEEPTHYKPIATLVPTNDSLQVNIGPLTGSRGPILFHAQDPIPLDVEHVMKNPSLFIVKIANYNLLDESGRNFAYASQEVVEKTTGLTIVYNNGQRKPETYRIATAGKYSPITGKPLGVSLADALKGLQLYQVDDNAKSIADIEIEDQNNPDGEEGTVSGEYYVENSFSVTAGEVTRVRDTQVAYKNGALEGYDYWVLLDKFGNKVDATSLETTYLQKKGEYLLIYTKDVDGDGLSEAEEEVRGTKDTLCDSDDDGVSDYREIKGLPIPYVAEDNNRTYKRKDAGALCPTKPSILTDTEKYAWRIGRYERMESGEATLRTQYYRAYSNPLEEDSDSDGINDYREFLQLMPDAHKGGDPIPVWRADPLMQDSDQDGLGDKEELESFSYTDIDSAQKNTLSDLSSGQNSAEAAAPYSNVRDSDGDNIIDGVEKIFGTHAGNADGNRFQDEDKDGLPDKFQTNLSGTFKTVCSGVTYTITNAEEEKLAGEHADTSKGDADGDGLPDVWEYFLCTNPMKMDTDGDGLSDYNEWDFVNPSTLPEEEVNVITAENYERAAAACSYAVNCQLNGDQSKKYGTDPKESDSDNDGLNDNEEIRGWDVWLESYTSSGRVAPYHVVSNPLEKDTDGDGRDDDDEKTNLTDPTKKDTDGDGTNDSQESALGRNPLRKDLLYRLYITKLMVIENTDDGADTGNLYGDHNMAGMHFKNIHLVSANGKVVDNNKDIISHTDIGDVVKNAPRPGETHNSRTSSWDDTCKNGDYKMYPVFDIDLFTFDNVRSNTIKIQEGEEHYLSFETFWEFNIDNGCDGNGRIGADYIVAYAGTLQSDAKIDIDTLISQGFVTMTFTERHGELLTAEDGGGSKAPKYSVVFTAVKE